LQHTIIYRLFIDAASSSGHGRQQILKAFLSGNQN